MGLAMCPKFDASHPLALCHMDIHPRNVLIDKAGTPRLMDWGFAGMWDVPIVGSGTRQSRCRSRRTDGWPKCQLGGILSRTRRLLLANTRGTMRTICCYCSTLRTESTSMSWAMILIFLTTILRS